MVRTPHKNWLTLWGGYSAILLIMLSFLLGSFYLVQRQFKSSEQQFQRYLALMRLVHETRVACSDLGQWQKAYLYADDAAARYLAKRKTAEVTHVLVRLQQRIESELAQVPHERELPDVFLALQRLVALHRQVIADPGKAHNRQLELQFRSLSSIIAFRLYKVQQSLMLSANQVNAQRYLSVIRHLLALLGVVILISSLMVFNLIRRRQAERQLQNAQGYLKNVLNSMPSILVGITSEGRVTTVNQHTEQMCGLDGRLVKDKLLVEILPMLRDVMHDIQTSIAERQIYHRNHLQCRLQEQLFIMNVTAYPLGPAAGQGAVIRLDDVTRQVQLETQLQQTQKLNAIGQLAGGVAHDFNNMLSGILGAAELLKDIVVSEEGNEYLEMIIDSATQSAQLTKKLLVFARKGAFAMAAVDVHKAIEAAVAILNYTIDRKVAIEVHYSAPSAIVQGDLSQLQNVVLNLGINAAHAMQALGGKLTISTSLLQLDESYCQASSFALQPGAYLHLEVRDTGCGIAPDEMPKIFEPFYTTKAADKGTGIGLASVYGIIQQHHGAISVYSELGRGTVFHIDLPLADGASAHDVHGHEHSVVSGSGSILIIDDEAVVRRTAALMLQRLGYQVHMAENAHLGLRFIEQNGESLDLVLLDMIMPHMDGRTCFYEIQRMRPSLPVIIASGFARGNEIEELRQQGLRGFLNKPYQRRELSHMVADILGQQHS